MFSTFDDARRFIDEHSIELIDLKFCDLWGRWHHVTLPSDRFTPEVMEKGVGFDGSSVGFKSINSGDMAMVPVLSTGFLDPFWESSCLSFICTTVEADTRQLFLYDPRTIATRAEEFLRSSGIAGRSSWGPEFEFYVFDSVSYENRMNVASYRVESSEGHWRSREPGQGYGIPPHGGYHAIPPNDRLHNLRARMVRHLRAIGVDVKYFHHEVGGPGQCEVETPMLPLLAAGDATMLIKYVARMTAHEAGLTATFMPKPLYGEAGSGMHFHQQLWTDDTNLYYDGDAYGCLSEVGRYAIGGLLAHGGSVLAFTNPSTNSYRRLVPGYEAPVSAVYSLGNRSAAVRIPAYANRADNARFEFRPPDATCNPYLALAAQLLAVIDGIRNRIDPTDLGFGPVDEDIFAWQESRRASVKALPTSLGEAVEALEEDHAFLLQGEVFSPDVVDRWIARKRQEQRDVSNRPHPYEMELYYDL